MDNTTIALQALCLGCGVSPGRPHLNVGDVEMCSACGKRRILYHFPDHDPALRIRFGALDYDLARSQVIRHEGGWCVAVQDRPDQLTRVAGLFASRREARDGMRELISLQAECEAGVKAWEDEQAHFDSGRSPVERASQEYICGAFHKSMSWSHRVDVDRWRNYGQKNRWTHMYWTQCGD